MKYKYSRLRYKTFTLEDVEFGIKVSFKKFGIYFYIDLWKTRHFFIFYYRKELKW